MNHPAGPPPPGLPTTTEQPRGSVAYRLQHAINQGNINPDKLDTATLSLITCLLAPIHGYAASIKTTKHHDQTKRRNSILVTTRRGDTAPPAPSKPAPCVDGGLLSHKRAFSE